MKKMKLLVAVLAIMMSFAFAACTSQTSETPSGHVHEWGEWTETKAPTCVEEGEETRVCKLDESHIETRSVSIDPDAHEWGEWVETKAPSYTEAGEETRTCKNEASHKESRTIEKLPVLVESIRVANGESITATHVADATLELDVKIKYVYDKAEKDATSADVTFTSNNQSVARVNAEGVITVIAPGEAEIAVESLYNNADGAKLRKTVLLTVLHAPITEITLTSSTSYSLIRGIADEAQGVTADATAQISLTVTYLGGEEAAATSADVTFASDDPTVASVNEDGLITFNAVGTATITIKSKNEKYGGGYMEETIAVTVNDLPKNETYLEAVSFTVTPEGENQRRIYCDIINNATSEIRVRYVDVYYLDETNKVIGQGYLILETPSGTPVIISPGETIQGGMVGENIPENIAKVWIYNRRTN